MMQTETKPPENRRKTERVLCCWMHIKRMFQEETAELNACRKVKHDED